MEGPEGVPAPNVYSIPPTIGFAGHTLVKSRLPAVTIGRKCACDPVHGHGLLYDLRDHSRFGKSHLPKYDFGVRRTTAQEGNPAPNWYYPKMDSVRSNTPGVTFKSRTFFGRIEGGYPSPNVYTLPPAAIRTSTKPAASLEQRFLHKLKGDPAPNAYQVPAADAYKYRRMAGVSMIPRRPPAKGDYSPPPNAYHPKVKATGQAKTFGQKWSRKRCVFRTVCDNRY